LTVILLFVKQLCILFVPMFRNHHSLWYVQN